MQANAPEVMGYFKRIGRDQKNFTVSTKSPPTNYGRQCLMARRMAEAGRALHPGQLLRQFQQPGLGPT